MNEEYGFLPLVVVDDMSILPDVLIHFEITTNYNINAVKKAMAADNLVVMAAKTDGVDPEYGVVAVVRQLMKASGKIVRVLFDTNERVHIDEVIYEEKSYMAHAGHFEDESDIADLEEKAMISALVDLYKTLSNENGSGNTELEKRIKLTDNLRQMIDLIAMHIPISNESRQFILGERNIRTRYEFLLNCISDEINMQKYKKEYMLKLKHSVEDNQKEYYLREQLNIIHKELGDEDIESEADIFLSKCDSLNASEDVKNKLREEIKRFKKLSSVSSEGAVLRGYIETLLDLPWNNKSEDNNSLVNVREVLEKNHYGLEKVKERIMETLAVRELTDNSKAPIICLIGPPGTGKTSIVKSVAEALEKKYIRICLGGVRDEAEIRGHRKTYVGAMPGRIITALKRACVSNPVILLDEIDKVSSDFKGDTHSALLEVLDPEQNKYFTDHYVEIPVDLSDVLFICTANSSQTIPQPLLDRMEVIEIAGYTANEKFHIAKEHLLGKQRKQNGLKKSNFKLDDGAAKKIINEYTREAGVRELERVIGKICRKIAMQIVTGEKKSVSVTERNLSKYLGKEKYTPDSVNDEDEIGIVRGLAWTKVGGDTLEIEVNIVGGKGKLALTGQMGDVMKESAKTAMSFVRSECEKYDVDSKYFEEHDIHVHIPEGAVPKDGPSAGITMATAIMSAVIKKKVRADIAMTGEITLRGRILPIGGLKEKLLAAKTAGIKKVLVPEKNKKDVDEIEEEITEGLIIKYVERMEQVLLNAFVEERG